MATSPLTAEQARAFLASTGWLADRPPDFAQALLAAGVLRHCEPGQAFNVAGDAEGGIWGIARGQASGVSGINSPAARVTVFMHAGYWGGTAPLFGASRIGTAMARTPATILLVPVPVLRRLLQATPNWWEHLGVLQFRITRQYGSVAADLQLQNSRARTAAILLHAADLRHAGDGATSIAITQDELGAMANLSRHPTGEHLRLFDRQGLISVGYGRITITDAPALRAIADSD